MMNMSTRHFSTPTTKPFLVPSSDRELHHAQAVTVDFDEVIRRTQLAEEAAGRLAGAQVIEWGTCRNWG